MTCISSVPADITLSGPTNETTAWSITFCGIVCGPDGRERLIPGFYDGAGRYIIRFRPDAAGPWLWRCESSDPSLDGQRGQITCSEAGTHQAVIRDPAHPARLAWADGQPFFLIGYEADWLFALDLDRPDCHRTAHFLDQLVAAGFNQIVMNVYARRFQAVTDPVAKRYDLSDPPRWPFAGSADAPDHDRLDPCFFQHLDRVFHLLLERDLIAHLMIYVWNKRVPWPAPGSVADNRYFDQVIARYQAFPNLIWDISKEALVYNHCDAAYVCERIDRLRQADAHQHLVTVHDQEFCRQHPAQVDMISVQHWGNDLFSKLRSLVAEHPAHPIYCIENGSYAAAPITTWQGDYQDPVLCLERHYTSIFAGAYGHYYWQAAAWHILLHDFDTLPVAQQPRHDYYRLLCDFFQDLPVNELVPLPDWTSSGYIFGIPGRLLLIFKPTGNSGFSLVHPDPGRSYAGCWFNPLSGERASCDERELGPWTPFRCPWGTQMALLTLSVTA